MLQPLQPLTNPTNLHHPHNLRCCNPLEAKPDLHPNPTCPELRDSKPTVTLPNLPTQPNLNPTCLEFDLHQRNLQELTPTPSTPRPTQTTAIPWSTKSTTELIYQQQIWPSANKPASMQAASCCPAPARPAIPGRDILRVHPSGVVKEIVKDIEKKCISQEGKSEMSSS